MAKSSTTEIAVLLDHLIGLVNGMSFVCGMKPAQWTALRYLARTKESGRCMSRFAKFHGTSKSAASQTLTLLIRKGYVHTQLHPDDPRVKVLGLTARGRQVIKHDPLKSIRAVLGTIDERERQCFSEALETLVKWAIRSQRDTR